MLETINHREAILFIEELVSNKEKVTEWNLRNIQILILKDIANKNGYTPIIIKNEQRARYYDVLD